MPSRWASPAIRAAWGALPGPHSPVPPGAGPAEPVGDQLEVEVAGWHHLAPRGQRGAGEVVAAAGDGGAHLGARPEQHHHRPPGQPRRQQVEGGHRSAALAGQVHRRDQAADRRPAGPPAAGAVGRGQQGDPGQGVPGRVAELAAARRGAGPGRGPTGVVGHRPVGEVDAEHRADAGGLAGPRELHRAVGAVAVGQRQGVHLLLGRPLDQDVGVGGAVLEGVAGRDAEMDEGVHLVSRPVGRSGAGGGPARGTARSRRGTGRRHGPGRRPRAR